MQAFPFLNSSIDPLHWPPRDPYDALKQSWEREAAAANAIPKSRYPPYHPAYSALDAEDDEDEDRYQDVARQRQHASSSEDEDDDDVPLSQLRHRSVKLRRGSEGLEVRPRGRGVGYLDDNPSQSSDEEVVEVDHAIAHGSDWEELYEKRREVSLYDSGSDSD